jgi:hypothetical protein
MVDEAAKAHLHLLCCHRRIVGHFTVWPHLKHHLPAAITVPTGAVRPWLHITVAGPSSPDEKSTN